MSTSTFIYTKPLEPGLSMNNRCSKPFVSTRYTLRATTQCISSHPITKKPTSSPSLPAPTPSQSPKHDLPTILNSARPFLTGELEFVDPNLPELVSVLRAAGTGNCWHKEGTFFNHLFNVYRILKLWKAPDSVSLCGLFHSAYSNCYIDLAIFDRSKDRDTLRGYVGDAAEHLIHLFCTIHRQPLIHDNLLFRYNEQELIEHLKASGTSLANAKQNVFCSDEIWRQKLQSILPSDGIYVKHIKTGEDVLVPRRIVAVFVLMTLADFSEQFLGYQDVLFDNENGRFEFTANNVSALWPGDGKPGLWMNSISRLSVLYSLILREEEIFIQERKRVGSECLVDYNRAEEIEMVIPLIFDNCTKILDAEEQVTAREMYWEAICDGGRTRNGLDKSEELLVRSIEKNPFVGEPYVVLAQVYIVKGRFEEAEIEAEKGLMLLLEWGSAWDKRSSWEGWISWARVLLKKAKEKSWPETSWGILNLGLLK